MYINQVNIWPIHACSTHMNSNKLQLHTQIRHTHTHTQTRIPYCCTRLGCRLEELLFDPKSRENKQNPSVAKC